MRSRACDMRTRDGATEDEGGAGGARVARASAADAGTDAGGRERRDGKEGGDTGWGGRSPPTARNIFADAQRRQWCRERQTRERRGHAPSANTGATALRCGNKRFVEELRLRETLERHGGCVNCVSWNEDASLLISGSDDMTVCVWSCGAKMPLKGSAFTGHVHNIFAAKFVPQSNNAFCVTTSADGDVRLVDLERGFRGPPPLHYGYRLRGANQPAVECSRSIWSGRGAGMGMGITFVPKERDTFLCAHQDGRVRLFDLRQPSGGFRETSHEIIVDLSAYGPTSEIVFDPTSPTTFATCSDDPYVRVFDLRHVKSNRREAAREFPTPPSPSTSPTGAEMFMRSPRPASMKQEIPCVMMLSPTELGQSRRGNGFEGISGLAYSSKGELAISCKGDDVYVLDTRKAAANLNSDGGNFKSFSAPISYQPAKRYAGRRNIKTFLKGVAFMCDDEYVTTGGDDGNVYVWHKDSCELVCKIQADSQVVNTVLPHPHLPTIVCCGIDNHLRVFEAGDGGIHLGTPPQRDQHNAWFDDIESSSDIEVEESEGGTDEDDDSEENGDEDDDDDDDTLARWATRVIVGAEDLPDEDDEDDEDFEPMAED